MQLTNPKLWWPAGYGDPNLYPVELKFEDRRTRSRTRKSFQAGVRQFAYSEDGGALRMWINGRRFIPRGGNWGFGESMLRYRAREYDVAVRYHRDMNFNMIRNWVGQIGDEEFYEAVRPARRRGVAGFLAGESLGRPRSRTTTRMFMRNVKDTVLRIRNHASIGLYCGRNEGYPPKPIDDGIRETARGTASRACTTSRSSADDVVSGHGPYQAMPLEVLLSRARHAEAPQRDGHAEHRDHGQPARR